MARRGALLLASLAGLLVVTGCSSGTGGTNATGSTAASPTNQPPVSASKTAEASGSAAPAASVDRPCTGEQHPAGWDHVVWIVMENRGSRTMASNRKAPYFNRLADACGLATVRATTHPSLPNYLALTSGSTNGVTDDGPPSRHPLDVPSIFSQLGRGGWRELAESMPGPCHPTDSKPYAVRHNPPTYYTNISADCADYDVPLGHEPDLSARFTFVTPNQVHNTHDSDVATGDAWLRDFMARVLASREYQAGTTAVFVTFDEAEDSAAGNTVATLVVAPAVRPGTRSDQDFSQYSILRTTEDMLGLPPLGNAATAASMAPGFGL